MYDLQVHHWDHWHMYYIYIYISIYACMYVRTYVRTYVRSMLASLLACLHACLLACLHALLACMHARTHARTYVRTYVCIYVWYVASRHWALDSRLRRRILRSQVTPTAVSNFSNMASVSATKSRWDRVLMMAWADNIFHQLAFSFFSSQMSNRN